jgi:putative hydrolase of the HAD superfamily
LLRTFEGVAETVDRMRADYTLAVITNGDRRVKWLRLNLGIELVVISAECGFEKPDPRIFAHACSLAGVAACEAAFVGDRLDIDIAGAKGAGLRRYGSTIGAGAWTAAFSRMPLLPDSTNSRT